MDLSPPPRSPLNLTNLPQVAGKRKCGNSPVTEDSDTDDENKKARTSSPGSLHCVEAGDGSRNEPHTSAYNSNLDNLPTNHATNNSDHNFPAFLVMEAANNDESFKKLSPFAIEKGLQGCIGTALSVKKLRSGCLIVQVAKESQSNNLLKLSTFVNCPVKVTPHRSMNSCKGVIRSYELSIMDDDELVENLRDQGVTAVRHMYQNRDNQKSKTRTMVLTFNTSHLPRSIKAGRYLNIAVEQYTPNPLRCFNCQKYGHHQTKCRHEKVCAKCGLAAHGSDPCSREPHCVNCQGDHPAFFTTCPSWVSEKQKAARLPAYQPDNATTRSSLSAIPRSPTTGPSNSDGFTKFLVLEPADKEKSISRLSPFEIEKGFRDCVGTIANAKKLSSGALLAQVQSEAQAADLQKLSTFASCPVKVSQHRSLNTSKGVIRSFDLSQTDQQEILDNLAEQHVTAVQHITQKKNGEIKNSGSVILTFSGINLPDEIKVGCQKVAVTRYIPRPLRCFGCQKFGHHQTVCKHQKLCANCGLPAHDDESPCSRPPKCVNCGGDHPAFKPTCPVWITETEICRVKVTNRLSYPEAKKLVKSRPSQPIPGTSYSAVLRSKPTMTSVATQTEDVPAQNPDAAAESQMSNAGTQTEDQKGLPATANTGQQKQKDQEQAKAGGRPKSDSQPPSKKANMQNTGQPKGSKDSIQLSNRFTTLEAEKDSADLARKKQGRSSSTGDKPVRAKITAP